MTRLACASAFLDASCTAVGVPQVASSGKALTTLIGFAAATSALS